MNCLFKLFPFLLMTLSLSLSNTNGSIVNESKVNLLKDQLLQNYSSDTIPTLNGPLDLSLGVAFRAFSNIDQKEGIITLNLWLRYRWNDYNLVWNESEWNISSLIFRTEIGMDRIIWTPDIYLYNTAENPLENLKWSNVKVTSNGDVLWSRPGIIQSTCSFDMTDFPYDRQSCYLKFGSWSYTGSQLRLVEQNTSVDLFNYQKNEEWELENIDFNINILTYACCLDEYYDITFNIYLKRLTGYYETNIIIPTFATASLILITLLIPWDSGERISFAVTVMLSIIVFLLILSDNLPKSNHQPLLSRMIMALTFFSLFGVFFTVIISALNSYNINKLKNQNKIENRVIRVLYNCCNLFCRFKKSKTNTKTKSNTKSNSNLEDDVFETILQDSSLERTNSYKIATYKNTKNLEMNTIDSEMNTKNIEMSVSEINSNRKLDTINYLNFKELFLNYKLVEKEPEKTKLQEECEYMIDYMENIYSIIFFISFLSLCFFMFSAKE